MHMSRARLFAIPSYATRGSPHPGVQSEVKRGVPISFSPPESGGIYFACIAYVVGVVFQLKLQDVQFRAIFFCVFCGVEET